MSKRVVNQYAAKCAYCRKRVDPYGGLCWKDERGNAWITAHEPCIPNLDKALPKIPGHAPTTVAPAMPLVPSSKAQTQPPVPPPPAEPPSAPGPFNQTFPPLDNDTPF